MYDKVEGIGTTAASQKANDFAKMQEMLKKHRALDNFYKKQTKVNQKKAESKEDRDYMLLYKKEDEQAKLAKMEKKRGTQQSKEREKIILKLAEKELRAEEAIETKSIRSSGMKDSARLLRDITQMDQYENMKRNRELQRAYKDQLIRDLIKKEHRYFRTKKMND